jgi:hypothetical protein
MTEQITTLNYTLPQAFYAGTGYCDEETGKVLITSGASLMTTTENVKIEDFIEVDLLNGTAQLLEGKKLSTPLYYGSAAKYGSRLYHFGGKTESDTKLDLIQWVDLETLEVGVCNSVLPFPLQTSQAITLDDKIYIIGGQAEATTARIRIFDPIADNGVPYYPQ